MGQLTVSRVLLLVAVVCFVVAFLIAASVLDGGNAGAWCYAGLASFAASFLP